MAEAKQSILLESSAPAYEDDEGDQESKEDKLYISTVDGAKSETLPLKLENSEGLSDVITEHMEAALTSAVNV